MRTIGMRPITLCVVLGILDACATKGLAPTQPPPLAPGGTQATVSLTDAADRMLYWREEARELYEMAKHREREADLVLKKQPGIITDEFVTQMRLFAHQLRAAAEYADTQARQAEQEAPHGTGDFARQLF